MTPRQLLLALIVVVLWGLNFVVVKLGLQGVPPLLLAALRFVLVAFPAVLFVPRPPVAWRWLLAYGLTISFGQFALLFSALALGMPSGLASLVLQSQAFFTLGLSVLWLGERIRPLQLAGLAVAVVGLLLISEGSLQGGHPVPLIGLLLTLGAAAMWGTGNIVTKKIGPVPVLGLVVWGALVPIGPFVLLSLLLEGPTAIAHSLTHLSLGSVGVVIYLALAATLIGYSLWGRLLGELPTASVAPLTLLVPVIGLSAGWVVLDEALRPLQIAGAGVVMAGLVINMLPRRRPAREQTPAG
ncbi:EamA family transporter [Amphibiibacter pelophylacis]|uniref:EamA family transporter n=1 Tax=Amphibiibacter pelophylacis TaxID=1799477 RepID=A0ACC6NYQ1_9BURK